MTQKQHNIPPQQEYHSELISFISSLTYATGKLLFQAGYCPPVILNTLHGVSLLEG